MAQKLIYPALLEFSENQIGVTFPDLPGCVTVGADLAEALGNAREALLFHLEGMLEDGESIPAATDYKTLKADAGRQVAIIDVDSPEKQERINISLSASDLARIDEQAKKAGQTRSVFMVQRSLAGETLRSSRSLKQGKSGGFRAVQKKERPKDENVAKSKRYVKRRHR